MFWNKSDEESPRDYQARMLKEKVDLMWEFFETKYYDSYAVRWHSWREGYRRNYVYYHHELFEDHEKASIRLSEIIKRGKVKMKDGSIDFIDPYLSRVSVKELLSKPIIIKDVK